MTEVVRQLLGTDGAGLVAAEEGGVLPPLQTNVAETSLVLLATLLATLGRGLVIHVDDSVLDPNAALQALLHLLAAVEAGNLRFGMRTMSVLYNIETYLVHAREEGHQHH